MKLKNPFIDESALEGDDGPKKSEDEVLMVQAKQHTKVEVVETYMALGMVIGLAAGAAVGSLLLGRMNIGMGLGMLIGLVAGSCIHKKPKEQAAEEPRAEEQPAEEQKAEEQKVEEQPAEEQSAEEQAAEVVEQAAARDDNEETKE